MNNCVELMELISAYADGELTQSDCRRVEEHLSSCESCSALLELYREISVALDESAVPAPEALCDSVMKKVLSEETTVAGDTSPAGDTVPATDNADRRKPVRIMLLRYAPLAACLAIILLAMPWIINSRNGTSNDQALLGVALKSVMDTKMKTDDNIVMDGYFTNGSGSFGNATSGGSAPAPQASPEDPQFVIQRDYDNDPTDYNDTIKPSMAADAPPMDMPRGEPEPTLSPAPLPAPLNVPDAISEAVSGTAPVAGSGLEGTMASAVESEDTTWDQNAGGSFDSPMASDTSAGILDFLNSFSDAYAWIEVTGELPELLKIYGPEPLDGWLNQDAYYMIPRAAALELIKEIRNRSDVTITYNYEHGGYALVLYSSGE